MIEIQKKQNQQKKVDKIYVPDKYKTLDMCIMAVNDCDWAIEFVPEELQNEVLGLDIPKKVSKDR